MHAIAYALADPIVRTVYLGFCFALLIVPIAAIAAWYRARVRRLPASEAVAREQARIGVRTWRFWQVVGFARDIAAGRYGTEIRERLNTLYLLAAAWAVLNAVAFSILIWADEANRP